MATYYDVLAVPPDATREEIERGLDRMARRLKQTAQWEQYQDQYRKIESTLLTPDLRRQYDAENHLRRSGRPTLAVVPAAPASKGDHAVPRDPGAPRKGLLWAGVAVLALALVYGIWWMAGRTAPRVEAGIYLLDLRTGQPVAVVVAREAAHVFPGKADPAPGALVYTLAQKRAFWFGENVLDILYRQGGPAPEGLLEEGRLAALPQSPATAPR